jgi:MFS family permease
VWHSILEGIRYVRKDVPLSSLILTATVINFCIAGPVSVGLPYLAAVKFGSPTAYAVLVSCVASGGLFGALLAGVWKPRRRGLLILAVCAFLGLCLCSIGLLPRLYLIGGVLLLMGAAAGLTNIHIASWCQQRVEPAVRGRVMSVLMFVAIGLMPFSLALAGVLAQWNMKLMFILAGAGTVIVTTASVMHRSVREIE